MNKAEWFSAVILGASMLLVSCAREKTVFRYDNSAPSAPRGVTSLNGDGYVILTWFANPEPDLAGYDIYRGATDCNGPYTYVVSTTDTFFVDNSVTNGNTYYYAVAAYDRDDLQSDLSVECIHDTPRPEGVVTLYDFNQFPAQAGFDFSAQSRVAWDASASDIYFEKYQPVGQTYYVFYLNANSGTLIQDFGYVDTLSQVGWAPTQGWSNLSYVEAIQGHAYIINTRDNNYAKIRVNQLGTTSAQLEWAYQLVQNNTQLKPIVRKTVQ